MVYLNPHWLLSIAEFFVRPEKYFFVFLLFFFYGLKKNLSETIFIVFWLFVLLVVNDQIINFIKKIVLRPRPGMVLGIYWQKELYSFPSAHSANSMALAVFLYYYFFHRGFHSFFARLAIVYSFFLGLFRLLANYHFPSDIFFGWLLGFFFGKIFWKIFSLLLPTIKRV